MTTHWTADLDRIAFSFDIGSKSFEVAWYGIILTCAMVIALIVSIYRGKKYGLSSESFVELFIICIPLAIIGARLGFVLIRPYYFSSWEGFKDIFNLKEGGLTIMTGVPFGFLGGYIWCKAKKVDFWALADIVLPVVLLAQGLGRWGNFMNQEIYGKLITNPKAQWFPLAVYIPFGKQGSGFYQAAFFYEMVLDILFFAIILIIQKRLRLKGSGILMYAIGYSFIRFLMDFTRDGGPSVDSVVRANLIFTAISTIILSVIFAYRLISAQKNGEIIWYPKGVPENLKIMINYNITEEEAKNM